MSTVKPRVLESKRFVIRKSLVGTGTIIRVMINGKAVKYDHDLVYNAHKARFDAMPCFQKYKSYTNTYNLPVFVREMKSLV